MESPAQGRVPPSLELCRGCDSYITPDEITCPHCGADVHATARIYSEDATRSKAVMADVERLLGSVPA